MVQAADGNFYGVTYNGGLTNTAAGAAGGGTVFKMLSDGTLSTLYQFGAASTDGLNPNGLIQATDGDFYGTTGTGGSVGLGAVFKLTPQGTMTTLASFDGPHGASPGAGLIQATDGNFYGTTIAGGSAGQGTIFKATASGTLTTLYSLGTNPDDVANPVAALLQAADGNFYGTTYTGGAGNCPSLIFKSTGCGSIFKITPAGAFSTLHRFAADFSDGINPASQLIQAKDGNFYGTANGGGANQSGTFFKFTQAGAFSVVYNFGSNSTDGAHPGWSIVQGADGNFYGITSQGGSSSLCAHGCGTLFQIAPSGEETELQFFGSSLQDGRLPGATPIFGADGNVYGTTATGGANGTGTIYRYSFPAALPAITGVLNGAGFQPNIGAGAWTTINGTNFTTTTDSWLIVNGVLPTSLDGVSVTIGGQPAYIEYISPTQINAIAPDVPAGSVPVIVTNANGASQAVNAQLAAEAPAFFQWGTYAVATRQDFSLAVKNGTFSITTTPAKPGDVIILWGTGFGATSPPAPAGKQTPSDTTYNTAAAV
ncbi:MAG TPA: choice-of-anchor tandem repeat GloVer-containing protein, partial [Bryobacteraceae bacterium]|nr:choice-of-anchor tandem repeat GloVer-containing protein [Bryobacteraceae bacterium]